jgi:hypothetical protein
MNTIQILKPIIDTLYEEMRLYQSRTDKRIQWLEGQLAQYKNKESYDKFVNELMNDDDNDDNYAEEALAPSSAIVKEEVKKEVVEEASMVQEDTKNIRMIGGKDAKEYMKEYQRNYRKKQKENMINKTN